MSERNLKENIIELLTKHHLLSATTILEKLLLLGKRYNKTSVYRALEQLEKEHAICRHHFGETKALYELMDKEHAHLVCMVCGKIASSEVDAPKPKNVQDFLIEHQHLTFLGKCSDCRRKQI